MDLRLLFTLFLSPLCFSFSIERNEFEDIRVHANKKNYGTSDMYEKLLSALHHREQGRLGRNNFQRMMNEAPEINIKDICGKSSSIGCGKKALASLEKEDISIHEKCRVRQGFLECVDEWRSDCEFKAKLGIYPKLPPVSQMKAIQGKVLRGLWTSGGCTLEA